MVWGDAKAEGEVLTSQEGLESHEAALPGVWRIRFCPTIWEWKSLCQPAIYREIRVSHISYGGRAKDLQSKLKTTVTSIESWKSHFLPVGQNIHFGDTEVGWSLVLKSLPRTNPQSQLEHQQVTFRSNALEVKYCDFQIIGASLIIIIVLIIDWLHII